MLKIQVGEPRLIENGVRDIGTLCLNSCAQASVNQSATIHGCGQQIPGTQLVPEFLLTRGGIEELKIKVRAKAA